MSLAGAVPWRTHASDLIVKAVDARPDASTGRQHEVARQNPERTFLPTVPTHMLIVVANGGHFVTDDQILRMVLVESIGTQCRNATCSGFRRDSTIGLRCWVAVELALQLGARRLLLAVRLLSHLRLRL